MSAEGSLMMFPTSRRCLQLITSSEHLSLSCSYHCYYVVQVNAFNYLPILEHHHYAEMIIRDTDSIWTKTLHLITMSEEDTCFESET